MGTNQPRLKGLFDRPISSPIDASHPLVQQALKPRVEGDEPFEPYPVDCPGGYLPNAYGGCDQDPYAPQNPGYPGTGFLGGGPTTEQPPSQTVYIPSSPSEVTINNSVNITDTGIQQISDQIAKGINDTAAQTQHVIDELNKAIVSNIQEESDSIQGAINNASTNLGDSVKITTAAVAASAATTATATTKAITDQINAVKNTITPILSSITGFINEINLEVQKINDTFIQPIVNLYTSTIGTISTLTQAIETDLHEGIAGLLKVPGQLADTLGSIDATLNRTVEQLGTVNKQTVTDGIKFLTDYFPEPLGKALNASLGGKTLTDKINSTFTANVNLSSEALSQVSSEAISGIGKIAKEMLHLVIKTFEDSINQMHGDWTNVGGMFVGLLDGLLGLLTMLTSIGALASPLIEAAEQEARTLVPTTKMDLSMIEDAMNRGFISMEQVHKELAAHGLDATRRQVFIDLSTFLADAGMALEWWYRGIISETDLDATLEAHSYTPEQKSAYKAGSLHVPNPGELLRWMNFGLIDQDGFRSSMKVLRHTDVQINAILDTYQERETPQTLSALDGLLENSDAGWISQTLKTPIPDRVKLAAERAGIHPDLAQYIWLDHWELPSVEAFIESYFRGFRTRTEVEQRMAIANIPKELWNELVEIKRPLLPLRAIPSMYKNGQITLAQAEQELRTHGHNELHIQLILQAYAPDKPATSNTGVDALHSLSVTNARQLWADGAITDAQYETVLTSHGYDAATAALQVKADSVTMHAKAQKQELMDLEDQVLAGILSPDDATAQLYKDGFTDIQISRFAVSLSKKIRLNTKIPSIADLNKMYKAGYIDVALFTQALQMQGWTDPWLSAYVALGTGDNGTTSE